MEVMNKNSISLILLCLIKNCLCGGTEYYNIPTKANAGQKQIEALESELFPKDVRDGYNSFTNPSKNPKTKNIKIQVIQKKLTPQKACVIYNNYIFEKLIEATEGEKIQKDLQDKNVACIIKNYLLPYSSFYLCKLLGYPVKDCERNFYTNLENVKKKNALIFVAPDYLNYLKDFKELNIVRYALSNLLSENTSHQIKFERPNQRALALWEIFIASILKTLQELDNETYNDFVFKFYSPNSQKGLLLNWEEFWDNYQDQAKALALKKRIKERAQAIKASFYESIKIMPKFTNCANNIQQIFAGIFKNINKFVFIKKKNQINQIWDAIIDSDTFSIIDILFAKGMLYYTAKVYLAHGIEPIYPNDVLGVSHCILLATMKQSILFNTENPLARMMIHQSANEESAHGAQKLKEAIAIATRGTEEAKKKKEELDQLLAEKKEQAEKYKQQTKEKEQKTLDDLDDIFGLDKANQESTISFQKTIITEDEYKALLEQACSTGDVMQHGSHATMRMTLEDEKGEARQVQVQGYKKHGSALKKGGKGKKNYAVLEQKEKKDPK